MKNIFMIGIIVFFIVGCGSPKIDTTSNETMKTSIQKVKEALPADKQKEFEDAIKTIIFSQMNMKDMFFQGQLAVNNLESGVKVLLHNKTGEEVILEAKKQRAAKLEEEIKTLEDKKAYAEKSEEELKKFVVFDSQFRQEEQKYSSHKQPIVELHVKNNTGKAISKVYFLGVVKTKGREIPWIKEQFNYQIAGGLESNEEAKWSLAPNMFSSWGTTEVPNGAILELTVERLDGADNKVIASTQEFTEKNQEILIELKQKLNEQSTK